MKYLHKVGGLFVVLAVSFVANRANGNGVTVVSSNLEISGGSAWNTTDGSGTGAFNSSGTDGSIDGGFTDPTNRLNAGGTLSAFTLDLVVARPYPLFPNSGYSYVNANASTLFHPEGSQLAMDLGGTYWIDNLFQGSVHVKLLDVTNSTTLFDFLPSHLAPYGGGVNDSYSFDVDPFHLYEFDLLGSLNVSGLEGSARAITQVQLDSIAVPDAANVLGLLVVSFAGLALFQRRLRSLKAYGDK